MPISTILISNSIDTGRQILNQVTAAINRLISVDYTTTGNISISAPNASYRALNVSSGIISGNGIGIYSIPVSSILGKITNTQLQNSSITINSSNGIVSQGTVSLAGSISLNVSAVDSITNTRTNLPASANSALWAKSHLLSLVSNASFLNAGILATSVGGTGQTSYPGNGITLVGNSISTSLVQARINVNQGLSATYGPGSFKLSANVIAGANTNILPYNEGAGIIISADSPPLASLSEAGLVQLNDTTQSTSLTLAATANSVNALYKEILLQVVPVVAPNRLIATSIYNTAGEYIWNVADGTSIIELTLVGAGGLGGGAVSSGNGLGTGGGSGQVVHARLTIGSLQTKTTAIGGSNGNTQIIRIGGDRGWFDGSGNVEGGKTIFGYRGTSGNIIVALPGEDGTGAVTYNNIGAIYPVPVDASGLIGTESSFTQSSGWIWYYTNETRRGGPGIIMAPGYLRGGDGADSPYGRGGKGALMTNNSIGSASTVWANGRPGTGYGAGGGGGVRLGNSGAGPIRANGSPGMIIIEEYSGT